MTPADAVLVFAANFAFIALKAFQQRNVMGAHYGLIACTSQLLALVEVYVIWKIAMYGPTLWMVCTLGIAGATGACAATWLHRRHVKPRNLATGGRNNG